MSLDRNRVTWSSSDLLTEVRRKAAIPSGSLKWTDTVLLREATDVLRSFSGWAMSKAGEGRLTFQLERTSAIQTAYGDNRELILPPHAVADSIDGVFWINASGIETRLTPIDLNSQPVFDSTIAVGNPLWYAILPGTIRIYPQPTSVNTFRINYQRRHPELLLSSSTTIVFCSSATGDTTSTTITIAGTQPFVAGETIDFVSQWYPYRTPIADAQVTAVTSGSVTVSVPYAQIQDIFSAGMFMVPSGQSPYVHLPQEFRACITFKVAAHVMRIIGDEIGAQTAEQTAETELGRVVDMLNPRVKAQRQKLMNPFSLMRQKVRRGAFF